MASARSPIYAFWCRQPSQGNFGDRLTPWLIRKLTGRAPVFARPEAAVPKYLVVGSIIGYATERCTVWGSGLLSRHDPISPHAELLAVRGPLTRARALECGADCPPAFGDPALLLPYLYRPRVLRRQGVGLVPHFSDKARVFAACRGQDGLHLIDVQAGIEETIERIVSCELVASSSLHGLIVAQAYGIPAVLVTFRDLPSGDGTKFQDYLLSTGQEPAPPVLLREDAITADRLARCGPRSAPTFDLAPLWRTCPWRRPA